MQVEVIELRRERIPEGIGVLARGMRDNPLHVAAFGPDADRRVRALQRMFSAVFRVMDQQAPICAFADGTIVGVTGIVSEGACQPTPSQRARFVPSMLALGLGPAGRLSKWLGAWGERDPDEPHSHLGPLAVDAHLQGRGIGSQILTEYCRSLDDAGQIGYLETDKEENVRLYERFGFVTVGEAEVIGVPNWFMRRPAQSVPSS